MVELVEIGEDDTPKPMPVEVYDEPGVYWYIEASCPLPRDM